jgi:hypothetical protein
MRHFDSQQAILTELITVDGQRRIHARSTDGSLSIAFDPAVSESDNHCAAAKALCAWTKLRGRFIAARLPDDQFCFVDLIDDPSGEIPEPTFVC